jgi:uncharacterized protein (DUF1330 family)
MKNLLLSTITAAVLPVIAMADPAYFIAQIQVDDWDKFMTEYGAAAGPSLMEYEAKILVGGPGATVIEGDWAGNHTVVIEFKDMDTATAWYNSPNYESARPLRHANTSLNNIVFANAFSMPE